MDILIVQKVKFQVVEYCGDAPEWVLVSITWENGEQQRGLVPCSVISSVEPAGSLIFTMI